MRPRLALPFALALGAIAACGSSPETSTLAATNDDGGAPPTSDGGLASGQSEASVAAADAAATTNGTLLDKPYKKLAVGAFDACVVDAAGRVACWGSSDDGATAGASGDHFSVVAGLPPATDVVMSNIHTCALTMAGDVYCWGSNAHNQLGHLGGTQGDATCPSHGPCSRSPVKVDLPKATAIGASFAAFRVCALVEGGKVECWGEASSDAPSTDTVLCPGELVARCYAKPTELAAGAGLTELAVGDDHICGRRNGDIVCWGRSSMKELSAAACPSPPCSSPVSMAPLGALADLPSLGVNTTCFRKASGDVACVGRNENGQLGHAPGTAGDETCIIGLACNGVPSVVPNLDGALALSRSSEWSWCAIAKDGSVVCWGSNGSGELGHPAGSQGDTKCFNDNCNPLPSAVPGIAGATAVSAGHWMACAIDASSSIWCWGYGTMGAPKRIDP